MQTFMPEPSFTLSLATLDYRRLGKQRVETKQILRALHGESKGWVNHPAVKMWRGYEGALAEYGMESSRIWIYRGYKDTLLPYFEDLVNEYTDHSWPNWIGNADFHRSHQSNLMRKDPEYYKVFYWYVPDNLPYIWPVSNRIGELV